MNLQGKKIAVTGADGFIGSHVVESLLAEGCDVRAIVFYNSFDSCGWLDSLPASIRRNIEIRAGDIRDPFGVYDLIKGSDVLLHLAALIAIPFSYSAPSTYIETNINGTLNVLQAARDLNLERVVVTSTSEVYGTAKYVPIDEHHPLQPQSPYAASKIGADALALSFHKSFSTPVTVLRPFNTYGPRQSARAVIPTIIGQLASGKNVVKLGALHPTRDFTFASDTAAGFLAAARSDASVGSVTNIGSGFEISIGDTARLIAEVMGQSIEIINEEERIRPVASEVERLFASVDKAVNEFAWAPKFGGLDGFRRGLALTAEWFSNPVNLARYRTDHYVT